MRHALLPAALLAAAPLAQAIVYVTDLPLYTQLADCAADAVSLFVQSQKSSACPEAVTALQSCVCSKEGLFGQIASKVSSTISYRCGGTASQDQASAQTVLSAYCNQDAMPTFPKPAFPVSSYITDIPEFQYLAPCAGHYLASAITSLTYSLCPSDAPSLATCACQKNQLSLQVSASINSLVKSACSSHSADIVSAQAFFGAFCALNNGTSSFPTASNPPGDMTYYITDMPEFSQLATCAQYGLSYGVFTNTYSLCPEGPQALASCACIKEGMPAFVSSLVQSSVKYQCSPNGAADVTSALSLLDYYCRAAKGEVKASGVGVSIAQTTPVGGTGGGGGAGAKTGGSVGGAGPQATGGAGAINGTAAGTSSGPSPVVIGGAVGGVVVGLAIIGLIVFFVMRSARRKRDATQAAAAASVVNSPDNSGGKAELLGNPIMPAAGLAPPSPSPSMAKHGGSPRLENVSPVSAHNSAFAPPPAPELSGNAPPLPNKAELQGQFYGAPQPGHQELHGQTHSPIGTATNQAELHGQTHSPIGTATNHAELQGQMYNSYNNGTPPPNRPELYGQPYGHQPQHPQSPYGQQPVYEFPGQHHHPQQQYQPQPSHQGGAWPMQQTQPPQELHGMGYQSGPVAHQYSELDGQHSQQPHAR